MTATAVRAALLAGVALAALVLGGVTLLQGVEPHDEGLMLQWASRIRDGEWPYRDFWMNYLPGQAVVLAGLGPGSLLAWRVLRLAVGAAVAVLVAVLVRREAGPRTAALAGVAAAGVTAFPAGPGPTAPALALALGALVAAPSRPRLAGVLAGSAIWFRPELGLAALLGIRRRDAFVTGALTAAALLAPFLAVAGRELVEDVGGFVSYQGLQRLPLVPAYDGGLDGNKVLETFFPLVLLGLAALWAVTRRDWRHPAVPLAVAGALYLVARADEFHLAPLAIALCVLLHGRAVLVAGLAVIALHGAERQAGRLLHPPADAVVLRDGIRVPGREARSYAEVVRAVRARVPEGEPVYVANPRHDRVRAGDTLLYVLLDRPNPTRYDVMQPGLTTTRAVQEEIVRDLRDTRVVVRWTDPRADADEGSGADDSSGVRVLDDHLDARFCSVARFGAHELLARCEP